MITTVSQNSSNYHPFSSLFRLDGISYITDYHRLGQDQIIIMNDSNIIGGIIAKKCNCFMCVCVCVDLVVSLGQIEAVFLTDVLDCAIDGISV